MSPSKDAPTGVRIIGGERRGKKLLSVRGLITRPTADRVRQSIFNILAACVTETIVLDIFAGTGALGIEALSRGARFALFIDREKTSVETIQKNLLSCRFEARATVIRQDIQNGLQWLKNPPHPFNLVFMDPPYNKGLIGGTLFHLHESGVLAPGALIVVEHSTSEPMPSLLPVFTQTDERKYGKTLVSFIEYII